MNKKQKKSTMYHEIHIVHGMVTQSHKSSWFIVGYMAPQRHRERIIEKLGNVDEK